MKSSTNKKVERVTILMPVNDVRRLKHAAVDAGRSTSAIAREALGKYLNAAGQFGDEKKNGEVRHA